MKNCCLCILILMYACILGCASPKYYKSTRYSGDVQEYLNTDLAYCHAVAQGMKPTVTPYIPPAKTTTRGIGIIADSRGNVYAGAYKKTTYTDEKTLLLAGIMNIAQAIEAQNVYEIIKSRCLSELGWYEISKEEYLRQTPTTDTPPEEYPQETLTPRSEIDADFNKALKEAIKDKE